MLVKGTNLAPYKRLTASLLWMDDEPLTVGKDYLVKIGTKTIAGIVAGIDYAIDVNTGARFVPFTSTQPLETSTSLSRVIVTG